MIDGFAMLMGFLVGMVIVYFFDEKPHQVVKHCTAYDVSGVTFVNKQGKCYQYKENKRICPTNGEIIEL